MRPPPLPGVGVGGGPRRRKEYQPPIRSVNRPDAGPVLDGLRGLVLQQ
jgi:hypothetical protein